MRTLSILALNLIFVFSLATIAAAAPPFPENFPATFPQYKSCDMVQTMNMPDNTTALLECGDTPPEEIFNFYKSNAQKDGWQTLIENKSEGFSLLMVQKDTSAMQVQVFNEDGVTQMGLSLVKTE